MPGRGRRPRRDSAAGALLLVGAFAAANALSHFLYLRADLSRGRIYSVGAATTRLLRGLPDPVAVTVYQSKELPPQIAVHRDYLRDLLKEYRSRGRGKVRLRFVDVDDSPAMAQEAAQAGVQPVRFDIISHDKYEQREGYLGVALQYRDRREAMAFVQDTGSLEYDLTSRIKTLSSERKPELAFLASRGCLGPEALDPQLRQSLETRYGLRTLDFDRISDLGVPPEVRTLLVVAPQQKFSERELWLLDQFLAGGRSLLVVLDSKRVDTRSFAAADLETGLQDWLARHGVTVSGAVALDAQSQPIQISVQRGGYALTNIVPYPAFVVATALDADHPVTKDLDSLVLPFASPIALGPRSPHARAWSLARSSKYSWSKGGVSGKYLNLSPFQSLAPAAGDPKGPFDLAVAVEDRFAPSYAEPPPGVKAKSPLKTALKEGRLAVVGTSAFLKAEYRVPAGNLLFFMNLADWLSLDADLIAIRSKAVSFHPLREISAGAKVFLRWFAILVPPALAVALGLILWRRRRQRRMRAVSEFGGSAAQPRAATVAAP